jgi:hypothetical protein
MNNSNSIIIDIESGNNINNNNINIKEEIINVYDDMSHSGSDADVEDSMTEEEPPKMINIINIITSILSFYR